MLVVFPYRVSRSGALDYLAKDTITFHSSILPKCLESGKRPVRKVIKHGASSR